MADSDAKTDPDLPVDPEASANPETSADPVDPKTIANPEASANPEAVANPPDLKTSANPPDPKTIANPLDPALMDKITNLAKRRGFVFPSAEIYGGFRSAYDFGPTGVLLLRNVKQAWWRSMVQLRDDVVGLDAAILSPAAVWEASGHLQNFSDPMVDCKACKVRHRADDLTDLTTCPSCGKAGQLTDARQFNLMFKTHAGPLAEDAAAVYLRPETAQGMFMNFALAMGAARKRPPFGIAQIGKSFRNEITPGNFIFRTREFEQMEMEYFVPPADSQTWYRYWCQERLGWYRDLGIPAELIRLRTHEADELSHYSSQTADVEFRYPWGWGELEGIANRGDYDLTAHSAHSGNKLEYFDQASGERYVPHVIEPAAGATRAMLAFLLAAYDEEQVRGEKRVVLRLDARLAPFQVAVLPLSRKEPLVECAQEVAGRLRPHWMIDYDETQSIGRRYRRQDELGTPLCVTVDFETLDDQCVTIRQRDSMEQRRVAIGELREVLRGLLGE